MNPGNFFSELRRRNVYRVAVAYAVIAWLLIQAGSIMFPTFEAPGWVMKVFVAAIAAGFPIALVLAWAFELTPEGIKRTEAGTETPPVRSGRRTWMFVVLAAGLLSVALFFLGRYTASPQAAAPATACFSRLESFSFSAFAIVSAISLCTAKISATFRS